jgi:hypothetical protein
MASIWKWFETKRKTNCLFQQKKKRWAFKILEIEMSWIPNFDVSVPRNEWYLLLKSFSIHLNPLSLFFNRFEKMSFCVVEIETSFNVFRNRNRYLLLSEKVFQFIWINWFFFFQIFGNEKLKDVKKWWKKGNKWFLFEQDLKENAKQIVCSNKKKMSI